MPDYKKNMGDNILAGRLAIGESQEKVALKAEVGLSTYRRMEARKGNVTIDNLFRVLDVLKIDPTLIFTSPKNDFEGKDEQIQRIVASFNEMGKDDLDYIEKTIQYALSKKK